MALPVFTDENDFRRNWIAPFLQKLGYSLVVHSHGTHEQGKDLFFADFDRFEHVRFYAVQAKVGNIGASRGATSELIDQVRRCFNVKIRWFKEAQDRGISAVYIVASGDISTTAREAIQGFCEKEKYGENVYFLDGGRLERLNQFATRAKDEDLLNRLKSFQVELGFNCNMLPIILKNYAEGKKNGIARCRVSAIENMLANFPSGILNSVDVQMCWNHVALVNRYCEQELTPLSFKLPDEAVRQRTDHAEATKTRLSEMLKKIDNAIREIEQRYTITVEVQAESTQGREVVEASE